MTGLLLKQLLPFFFYAIALQFDDTCNFGNFDTIYQRTERCNPDAFYGAWSRGDGEETGGKKKPQDLHQWKPSENAEAACGAMQWFYSPDNHNHDLQACFSDARSMHLGFHLSM